MPIMEWDNSLDVGVTAMNDDHKQILDAMNRIYDATQAGGSGNAINRLVDQLGAVCAQHFADEEVFLASIGYAGLKIHALIHEELLERYAVHAAEIRAAGGRTDPRFFHFLRHWLTAHIKGIDRKYSEQARTKRTRGLSGSPISRPRDC